MRPGRPGAAGWDDQEDVHDQREDVVDSCRGSSRRSYRSRCRYGGGQDARRRSRPTERPAGAPDGLVEDILRRTRWCRTSALSTEPRAAGQRSRSGRPGEMTGARMATATKPEQDQARQRPPSGSAGRAAAARSSTAGGVDRPAEPAVDDSPSGQRRREPRQPSWPPARTASATVPQLFDRSSDRHRLVLAYAPCPAASPA